MSTVDGRLRPPAHLLVQAAARVFAEVSLPTTALAASRVAPVIIGGVGCRETVQCNVERVSFSRVRKAKAVNHRRGTWFPVVRVHKVALKVKTSYVPK